MEGRGGRTPRRRSSRRLYRGVSRGTHTSSVPPSRARRLHVHKLKATVFDVPIAEAAPSAAEVATPPSSKREKEGKKKKDKSHCAPPRAATEAARPSVGCAGSSIAIFF